MGNRKRLLSGGNRKSFTRADKELIAQVYYRIGIYSKAGQFLGIPASSVRRVVRESEDDPAIKRVRARVLDQVAAKATRIVDEVMGSITQKEMQTENILVRDKDGLLTKSITHGPSLRDKAAAIGIMADKARELTETSISLRGQGNVQGLLLPDNLEAARAMLLGKMKRMRIFDVEFAEGETGQKVQEVARHVGITRQEVEESEEAEYDEMGPFDG